MAMLEQFSRFTLCNLCSCTLTPIVNELLSARGSRRNRMRSWRGRYVIPRRVVWPLRVVHGVILWGRAAHWGALPEAISFRYCSYSRDIRINDVGPWSFSIRLLNLVKIVYSIIAGVFWTFEEQLSRLEIQGMMTAIACWFLLVEYYHLT
jgi:hypothetical protein